MRLNAYENRCARLKLNATNGKGRPSVVDFFHFIGYTMLIAIIGVWYGAKK